MSTLIVKWTLGPASQLPQSEVIDYGDTPERFRAMAQKKVDDETLRRWKAGQLQGVRDGPTETGTYSFVAGWAEEGWPETPTPKPTGCMLKRLYAHNYRTFVNFEWSPPRSCVLVGQNGSGKSAFLEVIWLLQDLVLNGLTIDDIGAPSARTEWLKTLEQTFEIHLDRDNETYRYRLEVHEEHGRTSLHEELRSGGDLLYRAVDSKIELFGDNPTPTARTVIPFDRRRSFISALEERPDNRRLIGFRDALRSIQGVKPDAGRLGGLSISEDATLARDLSNFASWYRAKVLENPEAYALLREDLQKVLDGFSTIRLAPVTPEIKDLRVQFMFGGRSHELSWVKLSEGQRLLIALYGTLRFSFPNASTIVLDEVENYVAPAEVQPWLRLVNELATTGDRQVIVISHHPESINYMAADAIWQMRRDKTAGHSIIGVLEPDRDAGERAYDLVRFGSADA